MSQKQKGGGSLGLIHRSQILYFGELLLLRLVFFCLALLLLRLEGRLLLDLDGDSFTDSSVSGFPGGDFEAGAD